MGYSAADLQEVKKWATNVRANIVEMIPAGKTGHIGGSCSVAEIVAALYFKAMRVFNDPRDPRRDRCIFSKGHAVLAQYACFAELGYVDRSELYRVKTLHGLLQGHPDMQMTPGIEAVTGSLGQGLSISLGMALGLRLDGSDSRVYTIVGDGELSEGQIWEAAMAASVFQADNLCAIVDCNGMQATGKTKDIFHIDSLKEKWQAFGWHVLEIDGHDPAQILSALEGAKTVKGKPTAILARTVKGKGLSFAEGQSRFHNGSMTEAEYKEAMYAIEQMRREA